MDRSWPQLQQKSVWLENATRLTKGMDHAHVCHSSEHPGKHHYIKRIGGIFQSFCRPHLITDLFCRPSGQILAGSTDQVSAGINGMDQLWNNLMFNGGEETYNGSFVGFLPEGKVPAGDLEEMLDWNHILGRQVMTPMELETYRKKYIRKMWSSPATFLLSKLY